MKNLIVGQSGGPTAVINSSLAGVISAGIKSKKINKVFGALYGVSGILEENIKDLSDFSKKEITLLMQTPSAYLGSCRKKLPEYSEGKETYEKIFKMFEDYDIGYFFYIGGNDSMDTVNKLSAYAREIKSDVKIIGVPKTIDNDLALTDHTPGFGSAAKFVANAVKQIALDNRVYDMNSVTVVEIMGRNAGWLTAAAELCNDEENTYADIICLPEIPFDMEKLLSKIKEKVEEKKAVVIALSEGVKDKDGKFLCEYVSSRAGEKDIFNHVQMGGAGKALENFIRDELGFKVRSIELSTLQRCFASGGSKTDVEEAFLVGSKAVEFALSGITGVMAGYKRKDSKKYEIEIATFDTNEVANFEKKVPLDMITEDGFGITEKFREYALPLIQGEFDIEYKDGILKTL